MKKILYHIVLLLLVVACDEKKNEVSPDYGFTKIIGSSAFEGDFYPWDVKQTADGGYLILSSVNPSERKDIHLLKLDQFGEFEWEVTHTVTFTNPLPLLVEKGSAFYLFAMHKNTFNTHLLKVDMKGGDVIDERTYTDFFFPVAANTVPNGYLVQCFDVEARRTRLMKLNRDFIEQWREDYAVNEDPPEFYDHFYMENPLPFFCGHVGGGSKAEAYFFGGMRNYNLATVFVNIGDGGERRVIVGQAYDASISNMMNMTGNRFFVVNYNNAGENTVLPFFQIDPNSAAPTNAQTLFPQRTDFELPNRVRTVLKKMTVNGRQVAMMATETKSNETLINFYEPTSGGLIGTKRVGIDNPYLLGNVISTTDGGLLIMCKTYLAGKFTRIAVIKVPAEEVAEMF